jgi:hypothetical protein
MGGNPPTSNICLGINNSEGGGVKCVLYMRKYGITFSWLPARKKEKGKKKRGNP